MTVSTIIARSSLCAGLAAMVLPGIADARLTRFVVESRDPAPKKAGALDYVILRGHFEGELDPADPANAIITDIKLAPRNAQARVGYSATFAIAVPADPKQASGVLYYEVPNRGLGAITADEDGNIRVVSGWQGDIPLLRGIQTATVPVATGANGMPIVGPVLARFVDIAAGTKSTAIIGSIGWPIPRAQPVSLDTRAASLVRELPGGRTERIAPADWAFADCRATPFPGKPDGTQLCLRNAFQADSAYRLIYQGRDPKVLGIGFAATRDLVSFLRRESADTAGTANPVAGQVRIAVASGTSQSGNFLRSYINLGFNADEARRIVFDGINPNIAARQVPLNLRFGVPGGAANPFEPGSEGTLWWGSYSDRVRGRGVSSLLDRCRATQTCPKIVETFGSSEFWGLRMSPDLVGTDARRDIPLPPEVRRYYFPGVTHNGSGAPVFAQGASQVPATGSPCTLPPNPNSSSETLRALQKALIAWVVNGKEPPASSYPTLARGDLVAPDARPMGWPNLAKAPSPTGKINPMVDYDFGPGFDYRDESGVIDKLPPAILRTIPSLVPRVNIDGNEISGVPSVQMLVPLGTYLGWNVQARGFDKGQGCGFQGGYIPFAITRAERLASGDPRLSLEERYKDHASFVDRVRNAANQRVALGFLLRDDAARIVAAAEASNVLK